MIQNAVEQWQNVPLRKDSLFDTYFHTLSHDLRTPLTHITGFAELLKLDGNLGATQQEYASAIVSACSELQNTVLAHLRLIESSLQAACQMPPLADDASSPAPQSDT
ncbi:MULTISPECIES: histidine kinase dimerization/phospho-acceptor domain-containing protein [unclassified Sphingobium]|uniref:histidine kinase dimerization/phospho-acceptor domain-containing protein n=1 Tax=Sphingobium TaxID=165695 RepID=UPI0015EC761F